MATRSGACKSASAGAIGAGAQPALAAFSASRKRSMRAASEAAPMTSAPRNGALQEEELAVPEKEVLGTACAFIICYFPLEGISLTATDRLPFPLNLWGMYSSSTAWKLVPPKPKALRPARRTPSGGIVHGLS